MSEGSPESIDRIRSVPSFMRASHRLSAEKSWFNGAHRSKQPAETMQTLKPLLREAGITRIANVTGLDRIGIPVALAVRPNAWTLSVSSGKGADWEAASVSAAMEALELHYAETAELETFKGSCNQIQQEREVIDVDNLPRSKESLFNEDLPLVWTVGQDIVNDVERAIPLQLASLKPDYSNRVFNRAAAFPRDSNGLTSGNNFFESLCVGMCEIIERDAWACHLHASENHNHRIPKIDLKTIDDALVQSILEMFARAGVTTHLYDCRVDTDVPVYFAAICDPLSLDIPIAYGYGGHIDPFVAMFRALTEAAQSRAVSISGSRDDMFGVHNGFIGLGAVQKQMDAFSDQVADVSAANLDRNTNKTFDQDVDELIYKLIAVGVSQIVVVELASIESGITVLKVVIPGLEGCRNNKYVPGIRAMKFAENQNSSGSIRKVGR